MTHLVTCLCYILICYQGEMIKSLFTVVHLFIYLFIFISTAKILWCKKIFSSRPITSWHLMQELPLWVALQRSAEPSWSFVPEVPVLMAQIQILSIKSTLYTCRHNFLTVYGCQLCLGPGLQAQFPHTISDCVFSLLA